MSTATDNTGTVPECPDDRLLHQWLEAAAGPEPQSAPESVGVHVNACADCQRRLQALDHLERTTARAWHSADSVPTSEADGFVRRLCGDLQAPAEVAQIFEAMAVVRSAVEAASLGPGLVGPYRIEHCAGEGGMSVVYQAIDSRLGRPVALKMLAQQTSERSAPRRERIEREAEVLARLSHPHIVPLYEVGEHRGRMYLVLEYIDGPTLARWSLGRALASTEAAQAVQTLARAVQYAHEHGVIHRDLKPGNILLRPLTDGLPPPTAMQPVPLSAYRLMVADFGLACWRDAAERLTRSGQPVGTPAYMAPEQIDDQGTSIGPAADLYALGAILYELLTGRPPLLASTLVGTLQLIQESEPVSPRRLEPAVPIDLETITLKCLEKDPARRYATAAELADDLERFLARRPITARPLGLPGRSVRWAQRNRGLAVLGALSLVLVLALAAGGVTFALTQRAQRRESDSLRTQALTQARQAQAARDQSRVDLERAIQSLSGLGRRLADLGPDAAPAVLAARDRSFGDAVGFANQFLATAGSPEQWSPPDLRVALALVQMLRSLDQIEASERVLTQARAVGVRLSREHPERADILMLLAAGDYNEALHHLRTGQPAQAQDRLATCLAWLDGFLARQPSEPQVMGLRFQAGWALAQSRISLGRFEAAAAELGANLALCQTHRGGFPATPRQAFEEAVQAGRLAQLRLQLGQPALALPAIDHGLTVLARAAIVGPPTPEACWLEAGLRGDRREAHRRLGDAAAVLADLDQDEPLLTDPLARRIARIQRAEAWLAHDEPEKAESLARTLAADPLVVVELALPLTRLLSALLARQPAPGPDEAADLTRTAVAVLETCRAQGRLDPRQAHAALTLDPAFAPLRRRPELGPLLDSLQSTSRR